MSAGRTAAASLLMAALSVGGQVNATDQANAGYLTWTSAQAEQIGRSARVTGRVGGVFDLRVVHTEHSYNYKLRATWLTREVIRATARLAQLSEGLSNDQTETLVKSAESVGDTVIMVEIDPNEGSGVIPLDWAAFFGPQGSRPGESAMVKGKNTPALRDVRALSGVFRRDYNYDVFWVVFPLRNESGKALLPEGVTDAELAVRIYDKEGLVRWRIPESLRYVPDLVSLGPRALSLRR